MLVMKSPLRSAYRMGVEHKECVACVSILEPEDCKACKNCITIGQDVLGFSPITLEQFSNSITGEEVEDLIVRYIIEKDTNWNIEIEKLK